MDIRKFFSAKRTANERRKTNSSDEENEQREKQQPMEEDDFSENNAEAVPTTSTLAINEDCHDNDIGKWVGRSSLMTKERRMEVLDNCWMPTESYNFAADATHLKRKFLFKWLNMYKPWFVYSKRLKGAFCLFCVLFPPKVIRGVTGSFIIRPFTKYKDIHKFCKEHIETKWHKESSEAAKLFKGATVPVDVMMNVEHKRIIAENRKFLTSITKSIIFCGTRDLPLRGKSNDGGVLQDMLHFRVDSGDQALQRHMNKGDKNAQYTSPRIQNELISLCGVLIKDIIVADIKKANAYSILADESSDISGKEQLSIGVRFFDSVKKIVREEFLGFVSIDKMDAQTIAESIRKFIEDINLDPTKCVGQGYDGCSTMAGKDAGVQKIMRTTFEKGLYFHCASHRLNLVVNDLNILPEIRNCVATIKDIINFFRESVLRRNYAPNIPMLCETRWTQKYKSISTFKKYFVEIIQGLESLSTEGNSATRKGAYQLLSAATQTTFLLSLCIIDKYNTLLEPVANILQSKSLDVLKCATYMKNILEVVKAHRESAEDGGSAILTKATDVAEKIGVELHLPRITSRQQYRSNQPSANLNEYLRRSLYVPYLDSFISSLENRFGEDHSPAFSLTLLHPSNLMKTDTCKLRAALIEIADFYKLNVESEMELWHHFWTKKGDCSNLDLIDVIKEAELFFPNIYKALEITIAIPYTTATIERSFSTLRRVKTWLRSTMSQNRLNGLCMLSVHKNLVQAADSFVDTIIDKFAQDPRKLVFC